jgi:RNA polymerase sigma factor (sigma-70 family)
MELRQLSDEVLVARTRAGSDAAFAALYARHRGAVHARCLSVLRDPDEAADATQNAMLNALRSLRRNGNGSPDRVRPWLLSIAHNEAVSLLRRSRPADELGDEDGGAQPGADERAFERERLRQLVDDLNALPDRQRETLLLREASGFSYRHIASLLGTSAGSARQTVHQARRNLHKRRVGREHGWLGLAIPGLTTAWLARLFAVEELAANLSGATKAALVAGALVAGGGAAAQLGGEHGLMGAGVPGALGNPPEAHALPALPRRLISSNGRPHVVAATAATTAQSVRNSTPTTSTSSTTSRSTAQQSRRRATKPTPDARRPTPDHHALAAPQKPVRTPPNAAAPHASDGPPATAAMHQPCADHGDVPSSTTAAPQSPEGAPPGQY